MAQSKVTSYKAKKIEDALPEHKVGLVHSVFESGDLGRKSRAVEVLQADEQDVRDILSGNPPRKWLGRILPEGTNLDDPDDVFTAMRTVLEEAQPKRKLDLPGEFDRFVGRVREDVTAKANLAEHHPRRRNEGPSTEEILEGAAEE